VIILNRDLKGAGKTLRLPVGILQLAHLTPNDVGRAPPGNRKGMRRFATTQSARETCAALLGQTSFFETTELSSRFHGGGGREKKVARTIFRRLISRKFPPTFQKNSREKLSPNICRERYGFRAGSWF